MANTILTPTAVTREFLRILHQKLNFVGSINRQYDDSFAKTGAKIGTALNIRLPNQYVVRNGPTLVAQDTTETSVALNVTTQKGVDMNFTSVDLTMALDDFSKRIISPAAAVLAANIEADAMNMYKDVYQQVNNTGAALTLNKLLDGRKILMDSLTPIDNRTANLNTQDNIDVIKDVKSLFQDSSTIAKQYREGFVGRTAGFDFMENTMWPSHPRGAANAAYTVNGAGQTGTSLIVAAGAGAIAVGDIFTLAGSFKVHPETKVSTGILQQYTVTTAYAGGAGTITGLSPAIVVTGALQNVSASPTNGGAVTFAGTISTNHGMSMLYHEDAFTFATADLQMPNGRDWAARENQDGISIRIIRDYDINNDKFPCRLDVLYGYKTIRPQMAARLANN
jgi:P22 coat protein - gene protein 5